MSGEGGVRLPKIWTVGAGTGSDGGCEIGRQRSCAYRDANACATEN